MAQSGVEEIDESGEPDEPEEENALALNIPPSPLEPPTPLAEEGGEEAAAKS
jgi:hypothetical protein